MMDTYSFLRYRCWLILSIVLLASAIMIMVGCQDSGSPLDDGTALNDTTSLEGASRVTFEAKGDTTKRLPENLYGNPNEERRSLTKGDVTKPAVTASVVAEITAGVPVRGVISNEDPTLPDGSHFDGWTYQGTAGETIDVELSSEAFDAFLILAYHDGSAPRGVANDDDSGEGFNARLQATLQETGTYIVIANTIRPDERGAYELSLNSSRGDSRPVSSPESENDVPVLALGEEVRDELAEGDRELEGGGVYDLYSFRGQAGQSVVIDVMSSTFDPAVGLLMNMQGGEPAPVARDDDSGEGYNARMTLSLPRTATYSVWVMGYSREARGAYHVRLREGSGADMPVSPDQQTARAATGSRSLIERLPTNDGIDYAARYPGGGDPTGRYAVLVGIDDYPGTDNDLPSSVGDVSLMKETLIETFGFQEEDIVVITNEDATREHILHAFARHLGQAGPEGVAVFSFSGHGIQLQRNVGLTGSADPEEDNLDEAIAVWGAPPSEEERGGIVLDDELRVLVRSLGTDRGLIILDACHSGTGTRSRRDDDYPVKELRWKRVSDTFDLPTSAEYLKGLPTEAIGRTVEGFPDYEGGSGGEDIVSGPEDHVLLTAAAASELALARSKGWPSKGGNTDPVYGSVFTYFLTEAMNEMGPDVTFQELMSRARTSTLNYAQNRANHVQTPQLEGRSGTQPLRAILGAPPR